jgi:putative ABC transport system substrate-binding protein
MRRREFIAGLGSAAAWPVVARAQQPERMRRIGVLNTADENDPVLKARISAFIQTFADLGWTDGRNVRIDFRSGGVDVNRMRALAQELVGLKPDVILAQTTPATVALQRETRTIPIVFSGVGDPVASGLVERLNRPGGNITGFALYEPSLGGKWLELLSEIAPGLKRVTVMFNPDTAPALTTMPSLETAARSLKVVPIIAAVHSDAEIEAAITTLNRDPGVGLVVMGDPFTAAHRAQIISAAARNNLPAVNPLSAFAREGGLLSYGPDRVDDFRRAASYVDRILRGAKPAELPVQFPTKLEMVVNLKTAKSLGLAVPQSILLRADEVIE